MHSQRNIRYFTYECVRYIFNPASNHFERQPAQVLPSFSPTRHPSHSPLVLPLSSHLTVTGRRKEHQGHRGVARPLLSSLRVLGSLFRAKCDSRSSSFHFLRRSISLLPGFSPHGVVLNEILGPTYIYQYLCVALWFALLHPLSPHLISLFRPPPLLFFLLHFQLILLLPDSNLKDVQ